MSLPRPIRRIILLKLQINKGLYLPNREFYSELSSKEYWVDKLYFENPFVSRDILNDPTLGKWYTKPRYINNHSWICCEHGVPVKGIEHDTSIVKCLKLAIDFRPDLIVYFYDKMDYIKDHYSNANVFKYMQSRLVYLSQLQTQNMLKSTSLEPGENVITNSMIDKILFWGRKFGSLRLDLIALHYIRCFRSGLMTNVTELETRYKTFLDFLRDTTEVDILIFLFYCGMNDAEAIQKSKYYKVCFASYKNTKGVKTSLLRALMIVRIFGCAEVADVLKDLLRTVGMTHTTQELGIVNIEAGVHADDVTLFNSGLSQYTHTIDSRTILNIVATDNVEFLQILDDNKRLSTRLLTLAFTYCTDNMHSYYDVQIPRGRIYQWLCTRKSSFDATENDLDVVNNSDYNIYRNNSGDSTTSLKWTQSAALANSVILDNKYPADINVNDLELLTFTNPRVLSKFELKGVRFTNKYERYLKSIQVVKLLESYV